MKAFTVYQPYAFAIAAGLKHYETRPRRTNIRGRVAVHAGKSNLHVGELPAALVRDTYAGRTKTAQAVQFAFGAVIGTVEIVDCVPVEEIMDKLTERERLLGDYSPGRFAWVLENPVIFDEPFPARGQQGWWGWDETEACRERIQKVVYMSAINFFNGVTPGTEYPAAEVLREQSVDFLNHLNREGEIKIGPGPEDITLGNVSLDVLPLLPGAFPEISNNGTYRVYQNGALIGTVKYEGPQTEDKPGKVNIGVKTVLIPAAEVQTINIEITFDDKTEGKRSGGEQK